jgi:uncharacterized repeat protein (TIGR01451 family)
VPVPRGRGAYDLDFSAADPGDSPTYPKVTPSEFGACPTPSGSSGRAADPLPDATFGDPKDSVESLAPETMILGQIVPFVTRVQVSGSTSPEQGRIKIVQIYRTATTSGGAFGFDPAYGLFCAFIDTADSANSRLGAETRVESFSWAVSGDAIQATVIISGLVDPQTAVLETWVVLRSTIPGGVTGNVQSSVAGAQTCTNAACSAGESISVGGQTVPLLRVQEFFTSDADVAVRKADDPDPVVRGSHLTYTIIVTNNGPATANGVVVTDTLDPNTTYLSSSVPCTATATLDCPVGNLDVGQSTSIEITVIVGASAPNLNTLGSDPIGGTCSAGTSFDLCNTVSVNAINDDPSPGHRLGADQRHRRQAAPDPRQGGGERPGRCGGRSGLDPHGRRRYQHALDRCTRHLHGRPRNGLDLGRGAREHTTGTVRVGACRLSGERVGL